MVRGAALRCAARWHRVRWRGRQVARGGRCCCLAVGTTPPPGCIVCWRWEWKAINYSGRGMGTAAYADGRCAACVGARSSWWKGLEHSRLLAPCLRDSDISFKHGWSTAPLLHSFVPIQKHDCRRCTVHTRLPHRPVFGEKNSWSSVSLT